MTITFTQLQKFVNHYDLVVDNSSYEEDKVQIIRGLVETRVLCIIIDYIKSEISILDTQSGNTVRMIIV